MKDVAVVTHSFHQKSRSACMLAEQILGGEGFNIHYYYVDDWTTHTTGLQEDIVGYDVVLMIQLISIPLLNRIKCNNIVFMPMYDYSYTWDVFKWLECINLKILSPIKKMHQYLSDLGFNSHYFKYYPEPESFSPGDLKRVFLWQRINHINIHTTVQLLKSLPIQHIHLHQAVDPGHLFQAPTSQEISRYKITFSHWLEDQHDYLELIKPSGIYIAPRLMEGGGAAFTDAMKMGKVVIAHHDSAMNDYITHGETGFLYDAHEIKPIDVDAMDLSQIQKNAYENVQEGRKAFLNARGNLLDFIVSPPKTLLSHHLLHTIQKTRTTLQQKEDKLVQVEQLLQHDRWYRLGQLSWKGKLRKFLKRSQSG